MVKGFSAYDSALMFSSPFKILLTEHMLARTTRNYEKFTLLIPAMVNGAFACELFLKLYWELLLEGISFIMTCFVSWIFTKGKADKKALFVNCTDDREMNYFSETDSSSVL